VTATEAPVADPAPLVAALRSDAEDRLVPFSCPGHKRGQGAAGELRALLGGGVFDRDVWLNTGDHDRLRRLAEALAARTWEADRSFFLWPPEHGAPPATGSASSPGSTAAYHAGEYRRRRTE
jgi:arginine/lysine/ornithine decarboxylase